jgi:hypothetical protein
MATGTISLDPLNGSGFTGSVTVTSSSDPDDNTSYDQAFTDFASSLIVLAGNPDIGSGGQNMALYFGPPATSLSSTSANPLLSTSNIGDESIPPPDHTALISGSLDPVPAAVPAPLIGHGLPVLLALSGLLVQIDGSEHALV